jgi:hypothetical protein
MHVNIIACLLAAGFFGGLTTLDPKNAIPSQEGVGHESEVRANGIDKPDAYKVAVLISIGAAIVSLVL